MDKRELAEALILQLSETRMVPFGLVDYCSPFISARERDFIIAALREYAAWQESPRAQELPATVVGVEIDGVGRVSEDVLRRQRSAASQEGSAPASTPVATDGYQPVAPASAAPLPTLPEDVLRAIAKKHALNACSPINALTPVAPHMLFRAQEVIYYALKEAASCLAVPEGCVVVPKDILQCALTLVELVAKDGETARRIHAVLAAAAKEKPHG